MQHATRLPRDYLAWASLLAALVVTASAEYHLARAAGFDQYTAAALPAALDIYAVRALRARRDVAAAVVAMIATNAASHLAAAGLLPVDWPLVVGVSAIAPVTLWRVHRLAEHVTEAATEQPADDEVNTPAPRTAPTTAEPPNTPATVAADHPLEVTAPTTVEAAAPDTAPPTSPLVICGAHQVHALEAPAAEQPLEVNTDTPDEVTAEQAPRLATEQAREVIEACWVNGVSIRETARRATRSPAFVSKQFAKLDEARGPAPVPGQLTLVAGGDAR